MQPLYLNEQLYLEFKCRREHMQSQLVSFFPNWLGRRHTRKLKIAGEFLQLTVDRPNGEPKITDMLLSMKRPRRAECAAGPRESTFEIMQTAINRRRVGEPQRPHQTGWYGG